MWIARRTDYATRALLALALAPGNDRIQRLFEITHLITHFNFVSG